jgi:ABC-type transport system involved in multi-copper enzyme maturation permease subunit
MFALAFGFFWFAWLITRFAPGVEQAELMRRLFELLPAGVAALLGDEVLSTLTPRGLLGFAYQHPFALVMTAAWTVRVSAACMAGEIGLGTMDLLAVRPVRRGTFVVAGFLMLLAGLAVILAAGWSGMAYGLTSRPQLTAPARDYIAVAGGLWLTMGSFGAVGLAISAAQRSAGAAIGWTSGMVAASFALDYVAKAWQPLAWMRPLSLFSHFAPQRILAGGLGAQGTSLAVLLATMAAGVAAAYLIFSRRDL